MTFWQRLRDRLRERANTPHDTYPPEAAEAPAPDPVAEHYEQTGETFGFQRSIYHPGLHPDGPCGQDCCFEERLDGLHNAFDWGSYEREMANWRNDKRRVVPDGDR